VDVVSQFKNMYLGPTTDATKVTGIMNSQLGTFFTVVNDALDPMLTAWSYLSTTKTQADVTATLTAAAAAIRTQVGVFNGNIDSLAGQFGVYILMIFSKQIHWIKQGWAWQHSTG
jgi:hypothetical protein